MEKEMGKEKKMDMEISKMVNAIAARLGEGITDQMRGRKTNGY